MRLKRYANQEFIEQHNSFKQFKRWRKERVRKLRQKDYSYVVPNVKPDTAFIKTNKLLPTITWIGHSTFFIQHSGLNVMTDPVWAGQMAFQKRLAPPGIPIGDVPPVDVILISHSHYDHLNVASLRRLTGDKLLLVPSGLKSKLKLKGFPQVEELNWWESVTVGDVKFTFVPSQHWTRRNPWDMNSSHWGGWVMESVGGRSSDWSEEAAAQSAASAAQHPASAGSTPQYLPAHKARPAVSPVPTVYFAGDSGYFKGFKEVGERFSIDVALMPIGAYEPEWFMGPQHVTPEEALQAFQDVGARWFVPMHYGAFKLADDTPLEALDRLEAERARRMIEAERMILLPHGETWRLWSRQ
ncbi:MBL fold metallo-hydrolase [Paenibacillus sp. J5C_2022]|uniref:MBL fold metallo-hydrolase n=1 Tax=Paenibacillus sp. J5C2022 TaxID=2977129 RepID=UPI0021CF43EF|nr:MBL fold metallo-hydrolase [Paenibacillus sp. J5C2022]MCU6712205.1 MBL fold metallo-hydrolase [Paenibacillus sp. J5C2022]